MIYCYFPGKQFLLFENSELCLPLFIEQVVDDGDHSVIVEEDEAQLELQLALERFAFYWLMAAWLENSVCGIGLDNDVKDPWPLNGRMLIGVKLQWGIHTRNYVQIMLKEKILPTCEKNFRTKKWIQNVIATSLKSVIGVSLTNLSLFLHRRSRRLKKKKEATGVERVSEYLYITLVRLSLSKLETCCPNHVNKIILCSWNFSVMW